MYGNEYKEGTLPLAKMNLALHGLSGDIRLANSYYEDPHDSVGKFDFVMANPPFNVDKVDKDKLAGDPRFPFGLPKPDNANYLWIQLFYAALNDNGRAGFVMANSAADAGHSEREIRRPGSRQTRPAGCCEGRPCCYLSACRRPAALSCYRCTK